MVAPCIGIAMKVIVPWIVRRLDVLAKASLPTPMSTVARILTLIFTYDCEARDEV